MKILIIIALCLSFTAIAGDDCSESLSPSNTKLLESVLSKAPEALRPQLKDLLLSKNTDIRVLGTFVPPIPVDEMVERLNQIDPKKFSDRTSWRAALIEAKKQMGTPHELIQYIESLSVEGIQGEVLLMIGYVVLDGPADVVFKVLLRDDIKAVSPDLQFVGATPVKN